MRIKNSYRLGAPGINITSQVSGTREQITLYRELMRTGQCSPNGAVEFIRVNALPEKDFGPLLRKNTASAAGSMFTAAAAMGTTKVIPLSGAIEKATFPKAAEAVGTVAAKTGIAKLAAYKIAAAAMTGWGGAALGLAATIAAAVYVAKALDLKINRVKGMTEEQRAKLA